MNLLSHDVSGVHVACCGVFSPDWNGERERIALSSIVIPKSLKGLLIPGMYDLKTSIQPTLVLMLLKRLSVTFLIWFAKNISVYLALNFLKGFIVIWFIWFAENFTVNSRFNLWQNVVFSPNLYGLQIAYYLINFKVILRAYCVTWMSSTKLFCKHQI